MRPIAALNTSLVAPLLLAGCAGLGPQQQTCAPFDIAGQVGTTWVRSTTDTGSYGSGTSQASNTRLPKSTWRGQEVYRVNTTNDNPTLLQRPDGASIAAVNGDALVLTWDPPAGYEWPLYVGKSWVRKTNITNHARNETRAVEERLTVEAMEDVTVPAGKFRACRIRSVDNLGGDNTNWLSPEIGIFVKQRLTRTAQHASGAGTRETELVSHNIKRAGY